MKERNRLPVVSDLDQIAAAWNGLDAKAQKERERERASWERLIRQQALIAQRERKSAEQWRRDFDRAAAEWRARRHIVYLKRQEPTRWVGSSLGGPAPGPHYPSHLPGPGLPAYLHVGGRGTGGGSSVHPGSARGDYLLTDD